jgi:spore germination protein YaaH
MLIYTVKSGEDLVDIASKFGISLKRIAADNDLFFTISPTEGQNLVITSPKSTYTASVGDTIDKISSVFSIDRERLLQKNPELMRDDKIKNGDEIVIDNGSSEFGKIKVMASLGTTADRVSARKIMPYLTRLSIRCGALRSDGSIYMNNDSELRALARGHRVSPVLEIQMASPSDEVRWEAIKSVDNLTRSANNIKQAVLSNGYSGVNLNFGEIPPSIFENYLEFIETIKAMLEPWGIDVISTVPENTVLSADMEMLGDSSDIIALFPKNPDRDIMDVLEIEDLAKLLAEVTEPSKISLCVPMSALDKALGSDEKTLRKEKFSSAQATRLAMERRSPIFYDETRCLSEYEYLDMEFGSLVKHKVEFEGLEGLYEILCIGRELNIENINVFNADKYYAPFWTMLASLYDIKKLY